MSRNYSHNDNYNAQKSYPNNLEYSASDLKELDAGEVKEGIFELLSDGYGFIRCDNYLPGTNDVYVSPAMIRKYGLRTGDIINGNLRVKNMSEKFQALLYINSINGQNPDDIIGRNRFERLTPVFPDERIRLETPGASIAMRMMDIISPIGKGQRGMIVSQPKTGKTTLIKQVAKSVKHNYPKMHIIVLLIDERPEEVTDIKESIMGNNVEVIYST
ncbi:MAG: transcription termination factor Rho, partial [Lachnospiraceae bacterium]|nr:transcription termination factor Rho [Lachnospiraceae bacterium]